MKESIPQRWWKEFNMGWWKQPDKAPDSTVNVTVRPRMPGKAVQKVLAPRDKFNQVAPLFRRIQNITVNNTGTMIFHERFQFLKDVYDAWSTGKKVALVHLASTIEGKHPLSNTSLRN